MLLIEGCYVVLEQEAEHLRVRELLQEHLVPAIAAGHLGYLLRDLVAVKVLVGLRDVTQFAQLGHEVNDLVLVRPRQLQADLLDRVL